MAAFCPAVTRMACWVTAAGDDAVCPAELEPPCFPEPCAGWPTRNVPWVKWTSRVRDRGELHRQIRLNLDHSNSIDVELNHLGKPHTQLLTGCSSLFKPTYSRA